VWQWVLVLLLKASCFRKNRFSAIKDVRDRNRTVNKRDEVGNQNPSESSESFSPPHGRGILSDESLN